MMEEISFSRWLKSYQIVHRQSPAGQQWQNGLVEGSEHHASVRKDVECAFGILKKRFRKACGVEDCIRFGEPPLTTSARATCRGLVPGGKVAVVTRCSRQEITDTGINALCLKYRVGKNWLARMLKTFAATGSFERKTFSCTLNRETKYVVKIRSKNTNFDVFLRVSGLRSGCYIFRVHENICLSKNN